MAKLASAAPASRTIPEAWRAGSIISSPPMCCSALPSAAAARISRSPIASPAAISKAATSAATGSRLGFALCSGRAQLQHVPQQRDAQHRRDRPDGDGDRQLRQQSLERALEVGSKQVFGRFAVTPFAAVQFAELWQNGFTEDNPVPAGAAARSA